MLGMKKLNFGCEKDVKKKYRRVEKFRLFISPHFLIHFFLLNDIRFINSKYQISGRTLDIGCGGKPFRPIFYNIKEYIGIDFNYFSKNKDFKGGKPDLFFPENYSKTFRLPFKNESFDNVFSFQVLEHHKNPLKFFKEIIRITKKKGLILITAPFLYAIHEQPNDYWRITPFGLEEILKKYNVEILELIKEGSIFSTISILLNENLNNYAAKSKINCFISMIIYPIFLFFQYLSLFMDKIIRSDIMFSNYVLLIRKK